MSRRLAFILTISIAMVLALATGARANHAGQANSGTPDNATHCLDRNSVTTKVDTAVQHGIAELNRSDMDASLSCSGDVEIYDDYYGTSGDWNNTYGRTNCDDTIDIGDCNVFRVRYNLTYFAGYNAGQVNSGGCHELGHTGGLGHRSASNDAQANSCMWSNVSSTRQNYDTHDIDAINSVI